MTETNRYENGKIYKLVSNHTDKIYVGSTCKERLCQRLAKHKKSYKEWLKDNNKHNISSYRLFELGDVKIVLLESVNCKTKDELLKKEREYIEKFKDIIVNKVIPSRTIKEYREDNKQKIKEYKQQYHTEHKEKLKQKTYKYREEHIEEYKNYKNKYVNELYDCECGRQIKKGNKYNHNKTKIHLENI